MEKVKVNNVTYTVNFGTAFQDSSELILLKHYAPESCEAYEDPSTRFNKIDHNNQCIKIKQFLMVLPHSLDKEAVQNEYGTDTEDYREHYHDHQYIESHVKSKISIVDMVTIIPKKKATFRTEITDYCKAARITRDQFLAIGFLQYAAHVRFHQLGTSSRVVKSLCASAETFSVWFDCQLESDPSIVEMCGNVAHGECWATKKHLMNPVVHTWDDLNEYNRALVQAYADIVRVPTVSNIAFRFSGRDGHVMSEEERAASTEAILESCRRGGNNCWAILEDAIDAYNLGEASTIQMKVLNTFGAGKVFLAWDKYKSDIDMTEDETAFLENSHLYQRHKVKMMVGEGKQPTKKDLSNPKFKKALELNSWDKRLKQLKQYKSKHGDCKVPQKYKDNPQLGTWVMCGLSCRIGLDNI
eukprot:scaffold396390_cov156-Cyclotella_meneghiniana.AAC.1